MKRKPRPSASQLFAVLGMLVLQLACGPLGPLPGGALSGQVTTGWPDDGSFTGDHWSVQLEVRPGDPYSVNVWCVSSGRAVYIAGSLGSVWTNALLRDGRARLKVAEQLFDVHALRVTESAEVESYLRALAQKYESSSAQLSDFQPLPGEAASAVLFRLERS